MNKYVLAAFLINLASPQLYALRGNNGNPQNPNNNVVQNDANQPVQHMDQPYIVNFQPAPIRERPDQVVFALYRGLIIYIPDGFQNNQRNNQNQNQNQRP